MANILEPEDIEWRFISSMALSNIHHSKFINEKYGLEMEKITPKRSNGDFGKAKLYYFITGQEKEYADLQILCDDWNEIKNFDDPNNEIVWMKKIVPIIKLNE
jgi:hypothetical protein